MAIKVASFNTQHCKDFKHFLNTGEEFINIDLVADTIKDLGIEICAMQEMRGEGSTQDYLDQTKIIANRLGYYYYFGKAMDFKDGPYGNSIISKYPIKSAETVIIPTTNILQDGIWCYEDRSYIKAEIDLPESLIVIASHFGLSDTDKQRAVEYVVRQVNSLPEKQKVLLMGDFNMKPDDNILKPIFEIMSDTASLLVGDTTTFPSAYKKEEEKLTNPPRKIDYIFYNNLEVIDAQISNLVVSDHKIYLSTIK